MCHKRNPTLENLSCIVLVFSDFILRFDNNLLMLCDQVQRGVQCEQAQQWHTSQSGWSPVLHSSSSLQSGECPDVQESQDLLW